MTAETKEKFVMNKMINEFLDSERYKRLYAAYEGTDEISDEIGKLRDESSRYMLKLFKFFAPSKKKATEISIGKESYGHKNTLVFNRYGLALQYSYNYNSSYMTIIDFHSNFIRMRDFEGIISEMINIVEDCNKHLTKRKTEIVQKVFRHLIELNIMLNYLNKKQLNKDIGKPAGILEGVSNGYEDAYQKYVPVDVEKISMKNLLTQINSYMNISIDFSQKRNTGKYDDDTSVRFLDIPIVDILSQLKYLPIVYVIADDLYELVISYKHMLHRTLNFYEIWFNRLKSEMDRYMVAKIV